MPQDDFRAVTDLLLGSFKVEDLAAALGVEPQTAKQMRMRSGKGRRNPPPDWRARLEPLLRQLQRALADHLDPPA
jgi:transposase-like protein